MVLILCSFVFTMLVCLIHVPSDDISHEIDEDEYETSRSQKEIFVPRGISPEKHQTAKDFMSKTDDDLDVAEYMTSRQYLKALNDTGGLNSEEDDGEFNYEVPQSP